MTNIGDRKVTSNISQSIIDYKHLARIILNAYMKSRCVQNEENRDASKSR